MQAGWVWERLGEAIEFLQRRRDKFLDAGLAEYAAWSK